jgi:hypothetical protein
MRYPADCLGKMPGFERAGGAVVPTDCPLAAIPFDYD